MTTLAFDTEARGLNWWNADEQAFLVSWATDDQPDGRVVAVGTDGLELPAYCDFVEDLERADTIVCHNLSYDTHQLRETCGIDLLTSGKRLVDTVHLAQVLLPERRFGEDAGYKLKDLAWTYVDPNARDAEEVLAELAEQVGIKLKGKNATPYGWWELWRAYPEEMEHYAREDARFTLALYHRLLEKMDAKNRVVWDLERNVAPVLIAAEARGVAVDQSKVQPLKAEYEVRERESRARVVAALGEDALDGTTALLEALLAHGIPLHRETPKGGLATNQYALAEFEASFPVIADLFEWRQASKFLSTYLGPMDGVEAVHTSFWQMGAWTGRMSCSRPNMQNIPVRAGAEVREVFVPRPDHCFVVSDYDQIELRLLAHYLNDESFKVKIERGDDVFSELAAEVYGPGGPLHAKALAEGLVASPDSCDYEKGTDGAGQRGNCKNVTYAITYGAGAPRIADMLGISKAEGKVVGKTVKGWLPGYDALAGYNGRIRKKVKLTGRVNTILGRRQPVNKDKAYVGLNALVQGSAADIMKLGVIAVAKAIAKYDAVCVLFVHDEVVVECPLQHAEAVQLAVDKALTSAFALRPALSCEGTIAYGSYAEAK